MTDDDKASEDESTATKPVLTSEKYPDECEYFLHQVQRLGFWNISATSLHSHYASPDNDFQPVPKNIIRTWKHRYRKRKGEPNLDHLGKELTINSEAAMRELLRVGKNHDDEKVRIKALRAYNQLQDGYIELLEDLGYKPKVADKIEHDVSRPGKIVIEGIDPDEEVEGGSSDDDE